MAAKFKVQCKGGRRSGLILDVILSAKMGDAMRGGWSAEKMAKEAGCSEDYARGYLRDTAAEYRATALSEMTEMPEGVWPLLRSVAAEDTETVERIKNENPRSLKSEKRLTHAVHRLACIAAAAHGKFPDAEKLDL